MNFIKVLAIQLLLAATVVSLHAQSYRQLDGLYYETPDSANSGNKDFFNKDNRVYLPGKEFIFSYRVIKNTDTLFIRTDARGNTKTHDWRLVREDAADSLTIRKIGIRVLEGYGGLDQLFPDFSQTVIQQCYYSDSSMLLDGFTGIIENDSNTWLHPFRAKYFSVMEFSPFPYVKFPAREGNTWSWTLKDISERWSDKRIVEYTGKQEGRYVYVNKGLTTILTPIGEMSCYVIEGKAQTGLGTSTLLSYFNTTLGFVLLQYHTIDGSLIELKLVETR